MYVSVRHEIPDFLEKQVVYCDNLTLKRSDKICLILTKNLIFYEFQRKQLLQSIDLNNSCLRKVRQCLLEYNGPRGKWYEAEGKNVDIADSLVNSTKTSEQTLSCVPAADVPAICFGKYVYRNFEISKMYLLLRCWDKLVVLQRLDSETATLRIVAEYEQVINYKLVHGKVKFHVLVELLFENGTQSRIDFQEQQENGAIEPKPTTKGELKQLLERVRNTKAELQLHRAITQKDLNRYREVQWYGCNFLRSQKLEEKQMLSRCGDLWMRYTPNDTLVLGVPLVNNCAPPNLAILKYLKPLLKIDDKEAKVVSFQYRLYQLKANFDSIETLETYFRNEEEETTSWVAQSEQHLLPEVYALLLIKFEINQLISLGVSPLSLQFEVEKNMLLDEAPQFKTQVFQQQIFLKNIDFQKICSQRANCQINFKPQTIHQDFLAMAFTSIQTKLCIKFLDEKDVILFQNLLIDKFEFEVIERRMGAGQYQSSENVKNTMEVDEPVYEAAADEGIPSDFRHTLFYNKKPNSLWYGTLALKQTNSKYCDDELSLVWKFYVKSEQQMFLLLKLLFDDLLLSKCNIDLIDLLSTNCNEVETVEFEHALRQELKKLTELIQLSSDKRGTDKLQSVYPELMKLQMATDLLASVIK